MLHKVSVFAALVALSLTLTACGNDKANTPITTNTPTPTTPSVSPAPPAASPTPNPSPAPGSSGGSPGGGTGSGNSGGGSGSGTGSGGGSGSGSGSGGGVSSGTIAGVVVDAKTTAPVGGTAVVALEKATGKTWAIVTQTTADPAGNFSFTGVAAGVYSIVVSATDATGQLYAPTVIVSQAGVNLEPGTNLGNVPVFNNDVNPKFEANVFTTDAANLGIAERVIFFYESVVGTNQFTVPFVGVAPSVVTAATPDCMPPKGNFPGPPGCAMTEFAVSGAATMVAAFNPTGMQFQPAGSSATLILGASAFSPTTGNPTCSPSTQTDPPFTFDSNVISVNPGGFGFTGCE